MALVLLGPLSFVLAAHTVAVAVDDLRSRSRPLQVVFNAGQYCLALLAARWTWCALTGTPVLGGFTPFHGSGLIPALAAGAVFAVVNDGLVSVVVALAGGQPVRSGAGAGPGFQARDRRAAGRARPDRRERAQGVGADAAAAGAADPVGRPGRAPRCGPRAGVAARRPHRAPQPHPVPAAARRRARFDRRWPCSCSTSTTSRTSTTPSGTTSATSSCARWPAGCASWRRTRAAPTTARVVARLGGDEFAVLLDRRRPTGARRGLRRAAPGRVRPAGRGPGHAGSPCTRASGSPPATPVRSETCTPPSSRPTSPSTRRSRSAPAARVFDPATMTAAAERVRLLPQLQEAIEAGQLACTTSPRSTRTPGTSSASRPWSGGSTRWRGCCRRPPSSTSPRAPAS